MLKLGLYMLYIRYKMTEGLQRAIRATSHSLPQASKEQDSYRQLQYYNWHSSSYDRIYLAHLRANAPSFD